MDSAVTNPDLVNGVVEAASNWADAIERAASTKKRPTVQNEKRVRLAEVALYAAVVEWRLVTLRHAVV